MYIQATQGSIQDSILSILDTSFYSSSLLIIESNLHSILISYGSCIPASILLSNQTSTPTRMPAPFIPADKIASFPEIPVSF